MIALPPRLFQTSRLSPPRVRVALAVRLSGAAAEVMVPPGTVTTQSYIPAAPAPMLVSERVGEVLWPQYGTPSSRH